MNQTNISSYLNRDRNVSYIGNKDLYKKLDWILPIAVEIILITVSSWILISLIHFGTKTGKWNYFGKRNSEKLSIGHIFTSAIVCAVGCIVHPAMGIVYMSVGFNGEDDLCETLGDLMACAYGFAYLSLIMFLWLRQRTFFTNQMLNVKYSKPVRWFSAISIVVIYVFGGALLLLLIIPYNQRSSPNGCLYLLSKELQISGISSFVYAIFSDFSLMALFMYAMTRLGKRLVLKDVCFNKQACLCCSPFLETESPSRSRNRNSAITRSRSTTSMVEDHDVVRTILVKTLAVTTLAIIVDLLFQAYLYYLADQDSHRRFSILFASLHLFFRLCLIVLSFADIKKILCSICECQGRLDFKQTCLSCSFLSTTVA